MSLEYSKQPGNRVSTVKYDDHNYCKVVTPVRRYGNYERGMMVI